MQEVSREVVNGKIIITYTDGSTMTVEMESAPVDTRVDSQDSSEINNGHIIKND